MYTHLDLASSFTAAFDCEFGIFHDLASVRSQHKAIGHSSQPRRYVRLRSNSILTFFYSIIIIIRLYYYLYNYINATFFDNNN